MKALDKLLSRTEDWRGRISWPVGKIDGRLVMIGLLGVVLIAAGTYLGTGERPVRIPDTKSVRPELPAGYSRSYEDALEGKLANILSQVKGAGLVAVTVTLESSTTAEHAKNVTRETRTVTEKDNAGGTRTTAETKENEQYVIVKDNGADKPVSVREVRAPVRGVLVVAEGAGDSHIKAALTKAVEGALGIPSYRVTVMPQRR